MPIVSVGGIDKVRPFYNSFAWAYDLIIDAPIEPRCDFIERVINRHNTQCPISILDAGCGTGSYALELATRGHNVIGLDSSRSQLDIARSKHSSIGNLPEFIQASLNNIPFQDQFELLFCRGVLNDILDDLARRQIFHQFQQALRRDGLLIFDVRDWEGSVRQKSDEPVTTKELATERGQLNFVSRTVLDMENHLLKISEQHTLITPEEFKDYNWDLTMRCWSVAEISQVLKLAGFELLEQYGGFDESIPVGTTERIVSVARRIHK